MTRHRHRRLRVISILAPGVLALALAACKPAGTETAASGAENPPPVVSTATVEAVSVPRTLDQIGRKFGLSRERVRQIEVRAFEKVQDAVQKAAAAREKALVTRFGEVIHVREEPGLGLKLPLVDTVVTYDARILGLQTDPMEVTPLDDRRLVVDAFARWLTMHGMIKAGG